MGTGNPEGGISPEEAAAAAEMQEKKIAALRRERRTAELAHEMARLALDFPKSKAKLELTENDWLHFKEELDKTRKDARWEDLDRLVKDLTLLAPDRAEELRSQMIVALRRERRTAELAHEMARLALDFPQGKVSFEVSEKDWEDFKKELEKDREGARWEDFAKLAKDLEALYPDRVGDLGIDDEARSQLARIKK